MHIEISYSLQKCLAHQQMIKSTSINLVFCDMLQHCCMMAVASTHRYAHIHSAWEIDDTEVTLKRNPKTDGPRRATQKANMKCRERCIVINLQVHKSCVSWAGRCGCADCAELLLKLLMQCPWTPAHD